MQRLACRLLAMASIVFSYDVQAQIDSVFGVRQPNGKINHTEIHEASGLVTSANNPYRLWTHNDSGDKARVFLIDGSARYCATYFLQGVKAIDWEDIALLDRDGKHYLLVGDIGDNRAERPYISLYLFEEPMVSATTRSAVDTISADQIQAYVLTYEDGPRDAESLFFDPQDQYLYVVSKRDPEARLYRTPLPETTKDTLILRHVGNVPHTFITAADIRPDGTEILMKNLLEVYYWKRRPGESVAETLKRPPVKLPYAPEPQGEAIAFSRDGSGYYTLSESVLGMRAILYFYPRQQ